MASTTRKRSVKSKAPSRQMKRGKPNRKQNTVSIGKYVLPALLSVFFLAGFGFIVLMGYRTVTASGFFEIHNVEVHGSSRASKADINKIVESTASKTGSWNADLDELRARIEKVTFVKSATVTRVLPNGIRVDVIEKKPEAVVSLSGGNFLIDADGEIITAASENEKTAAVIRGWDESKTEKAFKENQHRVKLYQKMVGQWNQFQLLQRVREVNLANMNEPQVVVEDSGAKINVSIAKDELGKSLKSALEAIAGKGEKIKSVNASGVYPIIEYLGY